VRIKEQFNRYAISYNQHNFIQNKIVKILVDEIDGSFRTIADLGCGSGSVYKELLLKYINFKKFYAIDFAPSMLTLHPTSSKVQKICGDFNKAQLFNELKNFDIDLIISSSALQWASDLNFTFNEISKTSKNVLFFIFTSNTFKSLHSFVNAKSPIYEQKFIIDSFKHYFTLEKSKTYTFKLEFKNNIEMLKYIKKSGVSGGLNLGYNAVKKIIDSYPKSILEFEAILLKGRCL